MDINEIIDLLAAISPILSAVIAFITAKYTTQKEIRKQEMQWDREDDIAENRDFSAMTSAVSRFIQSGWSKHQREAIERITVVQTADSDPELDTLFDAVASGDTDNSANCLQNVVRVRNSQSKGRSRRPHKRRRR